LTQHSGGRLPTCQTSEDREEPNPRRAEALPHKDFSARKVQEALQSIDWKSVAALLE
jgi:hypothetical protein